MTTGGGGATPSRSRSAARAAGSKAILRVAALRQHQSCGPGRTRHQRGERLAHRLGAGRRRGWPPRRPRGRRPSRFFSCSRRGISCTSSTGVDARRASGGTAQAAAALLTSAAATPLAARPRPVGRAASARPAAPWSARRRCIAAAGGRRRAAGTRPRRRSAAPQRDAQVQQQMLGAGGEGVVADQQQRPGRRTRRGRSARAVAFSQAPPKYWSGSR